MKLGTIFSFALSSFALAFTTAAFASNAEASQQSSVVMHHVEIQDQLKERHVAIVDLDTKNETIKVAIWDDICGTYAANGIGHACLAMPIGVDDFELPYKRTVDGCGAVTYEARKDYRPADGQLKEILFVDNTGNTCELPIPGLHVLTVRLESLRGNLVKYYALNTASLVADTAVRDDRAIYESLNVEEVDLNPGIAGSRRTQKSVGGLTCTKSLTIVPRAKPSYSCSLLD